MGIWCVLSIVGGRLFGFVAGICLGILLLRACPRVRSGAGKTCHKKGPLLFDLIQKTALNRRVKVCMKKIA